MSLIVSNVHKRFDTDAQPVEVLRGVSFEVAAGQTVAVTGPSGSGKSTLLHLVGALDRPSSGTVTLDGDDPYRLPDDRLARFRNRAIGFVFQDHHLLPQYSVLENVLMPALAFPGSAGADVMDRAGELVRAVGLSHRSEHRPAELSGGERQRVAVARALILRPRLLLCDEPTGSLDAANAEAVARLTFDLHEQAKNILITVTHSEALARRFQRRLELREGLCFEA